MSANHVELTREGLLVGDELVPLHAGSVHYWRLERRHWRAALEAVRDMGMRLVDTYVPWSVHEIAPGELELGARDPQRDVGAFLRLAAELGLFAIVRPGPHINAELTYFGLPERIVWDAACQARSPRGTPVVLPVPPKFFPVPSYASEAFLDETARYFRLLGATLAPLCYPSGPIVLVQIDNEGALYFRDGAYDQDYHPDAVALYRAFLRRKYGTLEALAAAYGPPSEAGPEGGELGASLARGSDSTPPAAIEGETPLEAKLAGMREVRFADVVPPKSFDARTARDLAPHLDWVEFQEDLLATALERFASALEAAGVRGIPTNHNFPMAQDKTPLNAARIRRAVSFVGLDYYGPASQRFLSVIARRTTELAVRSDALGVPAFACEMGAGYAPYFPPLGERDNEFTILAAMAYGLRGFNAYMAVERDRWIGAPVDPRGRARPFAAFWRTLTSALERLEFASLTRPVPVRILVPRAERRLARVTHAFGPVSAALLAVLGAGPREGCVEDDLGFGHPIAIEADGLAYALEQALDARGVPYAFVSGEDRDVSLAGAKWIVCTTSGALNRALRERLRDARLSGTRLTIGPQPPRYDGAMRPFTGDDPLGVAGDASTAGDYELLGSSAPGVVDDAVARAMRELDIAGHGCDPDGVRATVHVDASGGLRVLFVLNAEGRDILARVSARDGSYVDALDGTKLRAEGGTLELRMRPKSVRMLAYEG